MGVRIDFSAIAIIFLLVTVIVLAILNLTAQPTTGFTELHFTGELPKTVEVGKAQSFSFSIHNLENRDMIYAYEVYLGPDLLREDSISLKNGLTTIIPASFVVDKIQANSTIPVSVRLLGKEQEIDFWVTAE